MNNANCSISAANYHSEKAKAENPDGQQSFSISVTNTGNMGKAAPSVLHTLFFAPIRLPFLLLFLFQGLNGRAQSNLSLNGYVKELGMYYKPVHPIQTGIDSLDFLFLNQIHNRLNFRWYATSELTFAIEARNRIFFGQMIKQFPFYKESIDTDNGFLDLGTVLLSGDSWFLHSMIDRAWVDYTNGNLQVRVGRQRINWGLNLVWNPNDIFNTFSYFEFDYEERPGSDAVKIQYYTGFTSSAELVYKIGRNADETSIAGLYRFSKSGYDFQFIGGWAGKDYVLGGGWTGDIKGGGFRGELSYFLPRSKNNNSDEALVASVSGDYTLKNSLYFHTSVIFNSNGKTGKAGGGSFFDQNLTAKMLTRSMVNLFAQVSYSFTPLLLGNFATIINPLDGSAFLGPTLTYSLGNNWELMVNGQLFLGEQKTEYGEFGKAVYGRIKWAF